MNNEIPFLWLFQQDEENGKESSGGDEKPLTASANEESKNASIDFE